jgi:two-component system alkaline phosphatase synthesis response regulator PhoP
MDPSEKKRILVIEDEAHIAEGLKLNLVLKGYDAKISADGLNALQDWKDWQPDLIVLDIMLPGIDGLSVLRNIRLEDEHVPILILSAKGDTDDKVKGFSYGVDDYLAKPFNLEEFLLRVERLLLRASRYDAGGNRGGAALSDQELIYTFAGNRIDFGTLTAYGPRGEIRLTEQDVKLLKLFITNRGKPISRKKLLEIGWGYPRGMKTRTIDNFMVRFRKYFEINPRKPLFFKSLRSVGYVFDHDSGEKKTTGK